MLRFVHVHVGGKDRIVALSFSLLRWWPDRIVALSVSLQGSSYIGGGPHKFFLLIDFTIFRRGERRDRM